ncbi:MAG: GAF domain-containing protein [Spirochaetota bacterium]|nr:GAF domain-containing protein [Spirochaetota bacterium]
MSKIVKTKRSNKKKLSSYQRRRIEVNDLQTIGSKLNKLLDVSRNIMAEMQLKILIEKVMDNVTVVMNADRSSLFLIDKQKNECWSFVAQGAGEIRFPVGVGLAGYVAQSGETINIPEAYADSRFNPSFDKKTGYRTRSILTMPMKNSSDQIIGVIQVLNKLDRKPFNEQDEKLLEAFSNLAAIALDNSILFEEVQEAKNFNESILANIHNGVITIDPSGKIINANQSAYRILKSDSNNMINKTYEDFFGIKNQVIIDTINKVRSKGELSELFDIEYFNDDGKLANINLSVEKPKNTKSKVIDLLIVIEDITKEKRMKSTLSQYMTKEVAEQVLNNEISLTGKRQKVTILFSDIRNFTTLSEKSQPEDIVGLLNEYFDIMIDIVFKYEGTLDKFIGDAIMAVFGAPIMHDDDSHRAVNTAIDMINALIIFNEKRKARGLFTIDIGIGISMGDVLAGNIGSEKRMEYTVIGDPVNLASRLESLTKQFPHKILISEYVYEIVKNDFDIEYLDVVNVKGKNIPVKIYGIKDSHFNQHKNISKDAITSYEI